MDLRRLAHELRKNNRPTSRAAGRFGARAKAALLLVLAVASPACAADDGAPLETGTAAISAVDAPGPPNLDLLFVIDNSPGMAPMQAKLVDEIPAMMKVLDGMPAGFPSVHIAVISTDMGAHSDHPELTGCTETGDQGAFQFQPRGTCTDTMLGNGATYLSTGGGIIDDATVSALTGIVQCVLPLGEGGCQYVHPLAAIARALGADGMPAPASNAGFLRPDARLAIMILSNQDDCSAASPEVTALYSVNTGPDAQHPGLGPLSTFRCNEWGHLCVDPQTDNPPGVPPETIPPDASGTPSAPTLDLTKCTSNEAGLLTPVGTFVDQIRRIKPDPDQQILVGLIAGPVAPYTVAWVPASDPSAPAGQLWPEVEHSCGAAGADRTNPNATELSTDGSFGDPSVRLTEFAGTFGVSGLEGSVCSPSYGVTMASFTALVVDQLSTPYGGTGAGGTTSFGGAGGGSTVWDAGAGGLDGSALTGAGGTSGLASGAGSGIGGSIPNGLRAGCACSVGTAAAPDWAMALLLIAPAILRRRSRRARET